MLLESLSIGHSELSLHSLRVFHHGAEHAFLERRHPIQEVDVFASSCRLLAGKQVVVELAHGIGRVVLCPAAMPRNVSEIGRSPSDGYVHCVARGLSTPRVAHDHVDAGLWVLLPPIAGTSACFDVGRIVR